MKSLQSTINLILKAVAVSMAVASFTLGFLGSIVVSAQVSLLGIGLFALALVALQKKEESVEDKA